MGLDDSGYKALAKAGDQDSVPRVHMTLGVEHTFTISVMERQKQEVLGVYSLNSLLFCASEAFFVKGGEDI